MHKLVFMVMVALSFGLPAQANSTPHKCTSLALRAGTELHYINGSPRGGESVKLLSRDQSESGTVLTWEISFDKKDGTAFEAPYQIQMMEQGCFIFSFSIPTAG